MPAGVSNSLTGSGAPTTDSTPPPDAFVDPIDAPPNVMTKTLEEATNTTLTVGASIACLNQNNGYTHLSSYYRVFDPSSFQVTSDFHVTQVGFQVEDSESGAGNGVQVAVSVGTYNTTPTTQSIDPAQMSQLATVGAVQVPQIADIGGNVNVPITATIPAGKRLYIQIDTPEGDNATHTKIFLGANVQAESNPGYTKSACSTGAQNISTLITNRQVTLLMNVTGTYQ